MKSLQQSTLYAKYLGKLGWKIVPLGSSQAFTKHIPLMGTIAKIQRPETLPSTEELRAFCKKNSVKTLALEATEHTPQKKVTALVGHASAFVSIHKSPFLPTKTITVDLKPNEEKIFNSMTEAKRRAVRKAKKNGLTVTESDDITDLISVKNKSAGWFGFITTYGIKEFWSVFAPAHARVLLCYGPRGKKEILGGILLVLWGTTAYYWIAGATRAGKRVFAPTLLVWEAFLCAKKYHMKTFDFVGVWDERKPRENIQWKGFTKFKEGFGGANVYYPLSE